MGNKPEKECSKVTAEEFVKHIEELGYFKYANPTHIPALKQNFIENFDTNDELTSIWENKVVGLGGIINVPKDFRYYFCDNEDLFEYGGVDFMLEGLKQTFRKLKFKCKVGEHFEEWDKTNKWLNHNININGAQYIIFQNEKDGTWGQAAFRFAEILNEELEKQGIEERIYLVAQGNDGRLIFLTKELYDYIHIVYQNDNWKPLDLKEWSKVMGVEPIQIVNEPVVVVESNIDNIEKENSNLFKAINDYNLEDAKKALASGADPNAKKENGETPLLIAAYKGDNEMVTFLLANGAEYDKDYKTKSNFTYLMAFCQGGFDDLAEDIVKNGADVNIKEKEGNNALILALLNYESTYENKKTLVNIVKLLINSGADINDKAINDKWVTDDEAEGWTALMFACSKGYIDIVKLLLDQGVDLKATDSRGITALEIANNNGHDKIVKLLSKHSGSGKKLINIAPKLIEKRNWKLNDITNLIKPDVDINAVDKSGISILMEAAFRGHSEIVDFLIKNGATYNKDYKSKEDKLTYLDAFSFGGLYDYVKELIEQGANIQESKVALPNAASAGHLDVVKLLIENGADIDCTSEGYWSGRPDLKLNGDNLEGTALYLAARSGNYEMVKLLIENGADLEYSDCFGRTALIICAIESASLEVYQLLIESGADINTEDEDGRTVLSHISGYQNCKNIEQYLIYKGATMGSYIEEEYNEEDD